MPALKIGERETILLIEGNKIHTHPNKAGDLLQAYITLNVLEKRGRDPWTRPLDSERHSDNDVMLPSAGGKAALSVARVGNSLFLNHCVR